MTTRSRALSSCLWLSLTPLPAALAQDGAGLQLPRPAPELTQCEPMLGAWEGSGDAVAAAGAKPAGWTAQSTVARALNGFFVEEKLLVSLGQGTPGVTLHTYYGFDNDARRFVGYGVNSMGGTEVTRLAWTDDHTLVGTASGSQDGKPYVERQVSRYAKDSFELRVDRAVGDGPFFTHVTGRFTRSKAVPAAAGVDHAKDAPIAQPDLKKLAGLLGTWKVKGTMIPAPGAPAMAITGTETIVAALGGSVLSSHTVGDPTPGMPGSYESVGYYTWDPVERAYDLICVSNMGEAGRMAGRFLPDGALVWTTDQRYLNAPSAARMVQTFKDGGLKVQCDRLHGSAAAVREFDAEYTRK